jgi:NAD-dependent histone deacetylase SIR2
MKCTMNQSNPSPTHWFIRFLDIQGKLLRLYSQNVDGLEEMTGMLEVDPTSVDNKKAGGVVLLHGSINRLRCEACGYKTLWTARIKNDLGRGNSATCPSCERRRE